jgi:threonine synthase
MDILISSNLERLLFHMVDGDSEKIKELFRHLSSDGEYTVDKAILQKIQALFSAGSCSDEITKETIAAYYEKYGYLCDTHTAVGAAVYEEYARTTGDTSVTVIASTANPYKFSKAVLSAVSHSALTEKSEFDTLEELERLTGIPAPANLTTLKNAKPRFNGICAKEDMQQAVFEMLGIE